MTRSLGLVCLLAIGAMPAVYGQSSAIKRAAATITEADIRRRIFLIADDSMGGRDTPSPGLTKTAGYIASEFRRFGLTPGGDSGSFLLSYPITTRRVLTDQSTVRFGNESEGRSIAATLAEGAAFVQGATAAVARGTIILLGGTVTADSIKAEDIKDHIVVWVPNGDNQRLSRGSRTLLQRLGRAGATAVVIIVNSDSAFTAIKTRQTEPRTIVGDAPGGTPVVAMLESTIIAQVPEAADQFQQLRAAPMMVAEAMPDWSGEFSLKDTTIAVTSVPDVVGILEGSDPVLKNQYVVFSAHMDHIGIGRTPRDMPDSIRAKTDTINNGADDDASGTVGVIELAEAFSQKGARPKRSMIFLTVSGEEKGLWGSSWFTRHPPVPLPQIVADLNADMIGRNWTDTIVAIGKEHSDLGATLNRVNAAHPELNMHAIDDRWPEESFYTRSDHYNFTQKGVPILFFFNGVHADYHRPSDSPDKIDAEKESRIVKLLFYLGEDVANAPQRPRWVPESYQRIVTP